MCIRDSLDIIERAAGIFDEIVVGVVVNLEKKTMFSFEERMEMIKEATAYMPNVKDVYKRQVVFFYFHIFKSILQCHTYEFIAGSVCAI